MPVQRSRTRAQRRQTGSGNVGGETVAGLPMLRTSERGTFKRCRWKWWLEFEDQLKPRSDLPPLRFGTLIHQALAEYYKPGKKRGPKPASTFEKLYEADKIEQEGFGFKVEEVWTEAGELGVSMLNNYVQHWGADDEWEVIATEQPFRQLVLHPETERPWFWYVGVIDGIWRHLPKKRIHIVDHKTAKTIQVQYLSLDSQATGYWTWGLDWIYEKGILKPNEKLAGMLYNHLRKAPLDDRPRDRKGYYLNQDHSVSKKQPPPYFVRTPIYRDYAEREEAKQQVLAEFADMERIRDNRNGLSPPPQAYKNQGQFTCPGCWAFDICELHEMGKDWHEMSEIVTKQWDPYQEHEVYTDETK